MTKRKFSGKRLYKVAKTLVLLISISFLIVGLIRWSGFASQSTTLTQRWEACNNAIGSYDCPSYLNQITTRENTIAILFAIGILLPIIFFGGTRLYKYIFPVETKKKK